MATGLAPITGAIGITHFREWSHAAQPQGNPDRIVMRFGLSAAQEARAIAEGRADWMAEQVPGGLLRDIAVRFPSQLHSFSNTETDFLQLNTTIPPFNDVRVRRALNFALDRRVLVRDYGGAEGASTACQLLPPGLSGYRPYCPYTLGPNGRWRAPDLARAKRLVAGSKTHGMAIVVWGTSDDPTISPSVVEYIATVLDGLGFRARAHLVPSSYLARHPGAFSAIQAVTAAWLDTSAFNFFEPWLSCDGELDHGWFCSPSVDREISAAEALDATRPEAAESDWARIDEQLTDAAVWVPFANPRQIDFVSSRVRGYQHNPYWDIVADQLSIGGSRR